MRLSAGAKDFWTGLCNWRLGLYLAWFDTKMRYRRSILGPFWITISTLVFVCLIAIVYGHLFHRMLISYLPFLLSGFIVWTFISSCVVESKDVFVTSRALINNTNMPYTFYVLKMLFRNLIVFLHSFLVFIGLIFYLHLSLSWTTLWIIPGFLLVFANVFWVTLLLSALTIRFRDLEQVITTTIQVVFFISPITWMPSFMPDRAWALKFNPITYLLDAVRSPLLGQAPEKLTWMVLIIMLIVGLSGTLIFFSKIHKRIAFWVL